MPNETKWLSGFSLELQRFCCRAKLSIESACGLALLALWRPGLWRIDALAFFVCCKHRLQDRTQALAGCKRTPVIMGGRKGWKGQSKASNPKGKGMGSAHAVAKENSYHLDVLRAYPGADGSIFIRRGQATKDLDLINMDGLGARLTSENAEACRRPQYWLSMLAASVLQAEAAVPWALDNMEKTGLPNLADSFTAELKHACTVLDQTQHTQASKTEIRSAVTEVLTYLKSEELLSQWQRAAILNFAAKQKLKNHQIIGLLQAR